MKILHAPFCFHPDPVGGTEVYVESLAAHLQRLGVQSVIAAPWERDACYSHSGLRVWRYAISQTVADPRELYDEGDRLAVQGFARILDEERPDVVHLHAFTRGVSLRLVREAKRRGIPVVFTYHTPTVSCPRGTLMRWGTEVCDGVLNSDLCARCTLQGLGLPRGVADVVGRVPVALGNLLGRVHLSGGVWTALRMRELIHARHATFHALMAEVDHVVALCEWTRSLLIRNGVPPSKITLSRQGLCHPDDGPTYNSQSEIRNPQSSIRIAFLGRLVPVKGPDIIIRAVRSLPGVPIELHLYGIEQDGQGAPYVEQLKALVGGDPRIAFSPPVSRDQVISLLRGYDLLAVPSRCLETGPLVVLEAFAAGIPVIGSNLGGIAELVEPGVNGLLVEPDSLKAWSETFQRLVEDRTLLARLRAGIRPPRTMREVAGEMLRIYEALGQPSLQVVSSRDGVTEWPR